MRTVITGLAIALTFVSSTVQAAEAPCLTPAEFTSLATYGLPSVISGVTQRCASTLPAGAWLPENGTPLAARYAAAKPGAWPGAKAAFMKLGASKRDGADLFSKLPDRSLQPMVDGLIEGLIGQQIPLQRCQTIDRVVRLLSPLPPENTAELIALAAGLGAKSGAEASGKLKLCPA